MEFYEILQDIMDEKKMSISDVAHACGLRDSTVRSIFLRQQKNVALEVAFKLSDGLGVSLERLNGLPEPKATSETDTNPIAHDALTPHEINLIHAYRQSDENTRLIVDLTLKQNSPLTDNRYFWIDVRDAEYHTGQTLAKKIAEWLDEHPDLKRNLNDHWYVYISVESNDNQSKVNIAHHA